MHMVNDAARLINDLEVVISTLALKIDLQKLKVRLEEVVSNYTVHRKSDENLEHDLEEKIDLYLSSIKIEGLSELTIEGYRRELNLFAKFVGKPLVKITTSDIRRYLASGDWAVGTVDKKLSNIKTFFSWLVNEELLLRDPSSKIKAPKKPERLPKGLTIEELEIVRESCKTYRERALLEVMYATGCRLSEVANMKKSDINFNEMKMQVIGKGNKERTVYLTAKSVYHLKKYLLTRGDDCEYLFVTERRPYRKAKNRTIQRIIDKIEQRADITKKLTPHVLRHTKASLMMEQGAELSDVQHILGHKDPSTTLVYAHVSEERKMQAHRKYHVQ